MTEKEKYISRLRETNPSKVILILNKERGLKAIVLKPPYDEVKVDVPGMTEEEIFGELNKMHDGPDIPDPEVLGHYSV